MSFTAIPRAAVDVIDGAGPALALLTALVSDPLADETLVIVLDRHQRGRAVVHVTGTADPDRVVGVLDVLLEASPAGGDIGSVVVASVRPDPAAHFDLDDFDRWLEMSDAAERAGVELLEWFVIGPGMVTVPRDLLGEPPRW